MSENFGKHVYGAGGAAGGAPITLTVPAAGMVASIAYDANTHQTSTRVVAAPVTPVDATGADTTWCVNCRR